MTNTWRKYLTDYNEGLGLVYERFVLNDFLEQLRRQHEELLLELQQRIEAGDRGRSLLLGKPSLHQRRRLWPWRKGGA